MQTNGFTVTLPQQGRAVLVTALPGSCSDAGERPEGGSGNDHGVEGAVTAI